MAAPALRIIFLHVQPLFDLGRILVTPEAAKLIKTRRIRVEVLLARHVTADWGDVTAAEDTANRLALMDDQQLISKYHLPQESEARPADDKENKAQLWVVTEADRSATTFLTPSEY